MQFSQLGVDDLKAKHIVRREYQRAVRHDLIISCMWITILIE